MAFVLQDVINEIEETRSLEPLKNSCFYRKV